MKIKEDYIECALSASKDEIDEFFDIIHLIDKTIEKDKLSPKDVESSEQHLKHHTVELHYIPFK